MRKSLITGILIAGCMVATLAVSRVASAQTLASIHPYNCRLVGDNGVEIMGSFLDGKFTNNSGQTRWVVCPVPFLTGDTGFYVWGTSTNSNCYLGVQSTSGTQSLYSPSGQSGNYWYWQRSVVTPGTYSTQIQCQLADGASIWHLDSY